MKATGIVRKVDELGRIVIPKEIRRTHEIRVGTPLEIYVTNDGSIVLKEYAPGCALCGNLNYSKIINGKKVCQECIDELNG
ncbi:MAG: AbrB/MazE/SpoVT family DNA-binding domain-containing protein [Firmicutes bacterium]|nr:AbrB/MazE/SpoVT family DNA-binding domain-containing protein [Bacillota bacterium]